MRAYRGNINIIRYCYYYYYYSRAYGVVLVIMKWAAGPGRVIKTAAFYCTGALARAVRRGYPLAGSKLVVDVVVIRVFTHDPSYYIIILYIHGTAYPLLLLYSGRKSFSYGPPTTIPYFMYV